jgi:hypothetical protein
MVARAFSPRVAASNARKWSLTGRATVVLVKLRANGNKRS